MKITKHMGYGAVALLSLSLVLLLPAASRADKQVNSGEILLISDEILGHSVEIERLGASAPTGNAAPGGRERPGGGEDADGLGDAGDTGDALASNDGRGNDHNRSGLGDGSNPGRGSDNNNSGNEGYDNPGGGRDGSSWGGRGGWGGLGRLLGRIFGR